MAKCGAACLQAKEQGGTLYTYTLYPAWYAGFCAVYKSGWVKRVQCECVLFAGSVEGRGGALWVRLRGGVHWPAAVRKQPAVHALGRGFAGAGLGGGVCGTPKVRGPAVQEEGSAASGSEGALCQHGHCAGPASLLPDQEVRLPWRGMCCE